MKEKRLAFGVYPIVSLAQARALRDEAKKKLADGIDPSVAKKEEKLVRDMQINNTFQSVALEWHIESEPMVSRLRIRHS